MRTDRAIEILERQRAVIPNLQSVRSGGPEFTKWFRDTEIAIERVFTPQSRNILDFKGISYSLGAFSSGTPDSAFRDAYLGGLKRADAVLASMIDELRDYACEDGPDDVAPDSMKVIEQICLRFHSAARQLQDRYNERPTIEINDEYDVQDLLLAFLKIHFDDIRPEEVTPSHAGQSGRVDFLLKSERIVIEVKRTRQSLKAGQLGEQLIVDRARYETHPDCDTLVCFVYDPEGRIPNPVGLERDLEGQAGRLKMRVIIAPRG